MEENRKLYRSNDNVEIAGVCAGIAEHFGLDVGKVRLATLVLILVGGLSVWLYIALAIVLPRKEELWR